MTPAERARGEASPIKTKTARAARSFFLSLSLSLSLSLCLSGGCSPAAGSGFAVCQRAAGSPTLPGHMHTHSERKYARVLLTRHRLSVSLAEERVCALTLAEGRREDIEVWQRDGSFLGMKEAGFSALLR